MHAELVHIIQLEATQLDDEVVGLLVGDHLRARLKPTFPASAGFIPASVRMWCSHIVVVVFPLLPVIPMTLPLR